MKQLKELARAVFFENLAANAHKKANEGARKSLFAKMVEAGLQAFSFSTKDDADKKLNLEVKLEAPEVPGMDVVKLRSLVADETFMKIVSATKKAVEELAGKDVAVLCEVKKAGTLNVSVKPAA